MIRLGSVVFIECKNDKRVVGFVRAAKNKRLQLSGKDPMGSRGYSILEKDIKSIKIVSFDDILK